LHADSNHNFRKVGEVIAELVYFIGSTAASEGRNSSQDLDAGNMRQPTSIALVGDDAGSKLGAM
jgi:hypothetical protein